MESEAEYQRLLGEYYKGGQAERAFQPAAPRSGRIFGGGIGLAGGWRLKQQPESVFYPGLQGGCRQAIRQSTTILRRNRWRVPSYGRCFLRSNSLVSSSKLGSMIPSERPASYSS